MLEAGDDLFSLNFAGLSSDSGEFLCRAVEFAEKFNLGDIQVYRLKQVHMKDRRKVAGIEIEFDPTFHP
ncbi:hypothetical protein [Paenibacillus athensensis]|uniref:hypothetical protein n=1 Tax=Paenibacillus athensensis TaxID=1967502 RepID=UPI001E6581B6|nr:hypothetical protein [Paenibacillus athensensis]